jgi:glycosyltransferase involved in cell wall biosynthesis
MPEKPLVSLIVLAYKQERFIREAVRSAFAQTYERLEIILSDDCSPDKTFEIIQEEARSYRGPHTVIARQTSKNLGLAANFNQAFHLTSGNIIVMQAGDDISFPQRVRKLTHAMVNPTEVDLVFSDVQVIDASGQTIRRRWRSDAIDYSKLTALDVLTNPCILGCSSAFSRSLMCVFGDIDSQVSAEDIVLSFRALLRKGIRFVDEEMVFYRVHGENLVHGRQTWRTRDRAKAFRDSQGRLAIVRDCIRACNVSGVAGRDLSIKLAQLEQQHSIDVACYNKSRVSSMLIAIKCLFLGIGLKKTAGIIRRHVLGIG